MPTTKQPATSIPGSIALLLTTYLSGCATEEEMATAERRCDVTQLGEVVDIAGGAITLGVDPQYREEGPPRKIVVEPFRIDVTEVTNQQFAEFVDATGYVTDAEKPPPQVGQDSEQFSEPGSAVFVTPGNMNESWWRWVPGANWRQPLGPGSDLSGKEFHPVVHISVADAKAYAIWKGGSLPSEDQWEYAARAGALRSNPPVNSKGEIDANHYQGAFPVKDTGEDGFVGSAPIGCFSANDFGLHDMIGNVWEWTEGIDAHSDAVATIKGGSFLCAQNYCRRYRPSARQFQEKDLGTNHLGFRLVYPATR